MIERKRRVFWSSLEFNVALMHKKRSWDDASSVSLFGGGMGMGEATWPEDILEGALGRDG